MTSLAMQRTFNKQKALLYAGYAVFFLICFVLSAYFTFPYERVRDLLERKVSASGGSPETQTKLTIGELGPHWLTGVALSAVELERTSGADDDAPARIAFDELTLHASPLALLGSLNVDFGARVGDGDIDGSFQPGSEDAPTQIEAELDAVDLARLGLGSFAGLPLQGQASGDVDLTLAQRAEETQGDVELRIEGLRLGDGKAKVKIPGMAGGLTLEALDAGTLELEVNVRDGVATIAKLEAKGKDVELTGSGSVRIASPLSVSRADITLGVKFADAYKQRNDRTRAVFELMTQTPLIKRSTGPDGTMRFKLTGPLTRLQSVPAGPAPRNVKAAAAAQNGPD